ncbi:C40 family peptidase [Actinomadura montaniterrae]|nr:NlpC/P60 family protein [Actinomadura montaniterrae]
MRLIVFVVGCNTIGLLGLLFMFIVVLLVLPIGNSGMQQACAPINHQAGTGVAQANAKAAPNGIPSNYYRLYREAGEKWRIPWNILAGVGWVETKHGTIGASREDGPNEAGAAGPMQFKLGTFNQYKDDADGHGADRYDAADAIYSAAKMLRTQIPSYGALDRDFTDDELRRTIFAYNHGASAPYDPSKQDAYVQLVVAQANIYDKNHTLSAANSVGASACSPGTGLGSGTFGQRIADAAAFWAKKETGTPKPPQQNDESTPYSWGGGRVTGPYHGICCSPSGYDARRVVGFDCSSLAQYAVYQASEGKISMPRTSQAMWRSNMGIRVPRGEEAPGDLVFFHGPAPTHMGIYYGKVSGVRWMVEATRSGDFIRFSKFDGRTGYLGALRVTPPPGTKNEPSKVIRAMAPVSEESGGGATW